MREEHRNNARVEPLVPKKLSDRKHNSIACGLRTTRDHTSALEILRRGLKTATPALAGVAFEALDLAMGRSQCGQQLEGHLIRSVIVDVDACDENP
jgi:hypothetical protein